MLPRDSQVDGDGIETGTDGGTDSEGRGAILADPRASARQDHGN